MPNVLILNQVEVERALDLDQLLDSLRQALMALSAGEAQVPPRQAAFARHGFLGVMPAYVSSPATLAVKLVSVFHENHARGLPSHQATISLFDPDTGSPLAIMDGTHITAIRTAGVSMVAAQIQMRPGPARVAVLGAGVQGRSHVAYLDRMPWVEEIRVCSRSAEHATALASTSAKARAVEGYAEAVSGVDAVFCCTNSASPLIDLDLLSPGTHVSSVGVPGRGSELDPGIVAAAEASGDILVESRAATLLPFPTGAFELESVDPARVGEIGEVLSGKRAGRSSESAVTLFKSVGNAVEDAVAARLVYLRARDLGLGVNVTL